MPVLASGKRSILLLINGCSYSREALQRAVSSASRKAQARPLRGNVYPYSLHHGLPGMGMTANSRGNKP